jgi:bacteriophage N4 adsorption protein B
MAALLFDALFHSLSLVMRELTLFASIGFLIFGLDEIAVDALYLYRALWRRLFIFSHFTPATVETLTPAKLPGRMAVFIPAWKESAVIGPMLRHMLVAYGEGAYDVFVGCYPNDDETRWAISRVASNKIHIVVADRPGPTTKADCLNHIWAAMCAFERRQGIRFKGVILHDSEDVASAAELPIYDRMLETFDLVQLPVIPIVDPESWLIGGHYCDEFAEAHGKTMVVREYLGAGIPSAGVGCAINREFLTRFADQASGNPFDPGTLTEDYELGLRMSARGGRTAFVRLRTTLPPGIAGTSAHFPATLETSVRQKTRWMIGIALAGWDRLGWSGGWGERWMRLRDRRALFAALLLFAGYVAFCLYGILLICSAISGRNVTFFTPTLAALLQINMAMLGWRILVRAWFAGTVYGWRQSLLSVVRLPISNIIAILAARRAVFQYWRMLRSGIIVWDKTAHKFPNQPIP